MKLEQFYEAVKCSHATMYDFVKPAEIDDEGAFVTKVVNVEGEDTIEYDYTYSVMHEVNGVLFTCIARNGNVEGAMQSVCLPVNHGWDNHIIIGLFATLSSGARHTLNNIYEYHIAMEKT